MQGRFKIIQQYEAAKIVIIYSNKSNNQMHQISQLYCLSFKYSSTCFGHSRAHYQELINCSSRLWFTVGKWW
jgi:hypothetical protein